MASKGLVGLALQGDQGCRSCDFAPRSARTHSGRGIELIALHAEHLFAHRPTEPNKDLMHQECPLVDGAGFGELHSFKVQAKRKLWPGCRANMGWSCLKPVVQRAGSKNLALSCLPLIELLQESLINISEFEKILFQEGVLTCQHLWRAMTTKSCTKFAVRTKTITRSN